MGAFGDAEYLGMLHASAFDSAGQRLFVTLFTDANTQAIGVVDLKAGADAAREALDPSWSRKRRHQHRPQAR